MYLMYDDDGSFIGIVKENPMAETYHDINWFLVEVPDLILTMIHGSGNLLLL